MKPSAEEDEAALPATNTDGSAGAAEALPAAAPGAAEEEEEELPDVDDEPELACWGGVQQADSQSEGEQGSEAHMGLHEGEGDVAGLVAAKGVAAAGNTPGAPQLQAEDEFDFG
jgi:hypothetical protein